MFARLSSGARLFCSSASSNGIFNARNNGRSSASTAYRPAFLAAACEFFNTSYEPDSSGNNGSFISFSIAITGMLPDTLDKNCSTARVLSSSLVRGD